MKRKAAPSRIRMSGRRRRILQPLMQAQDEVDAEAADAVAEAEAGPLVRRELPERALRRQAVKAAVDLAAGEAEEWRVRRREL